MKRGIIYILLILVCIYIGIINREEAYFYVAALMLAVMVCLLAGLFTRFFRTGISMQMNIPVVEKNRTYREIELRSGTLCVSSFQGHGSGYEEETEQHF
jgi:hypothetical protein